MGRGLHTVLVRRRAPPRKLGPRVAPARWCGLALRPRPPRERLAALGRALCRSSRIPPPSPRRSPFWGRGGAPSALGGAEGRSCRSQAGGGGAGGGRRGGAAPPPPALSGVGRPAVVSGVPPPGYTRAVGVAGRPRASGGGGGAPWFAPPSSPGRPLIGPLRLRRPGLRRSAVGRQPAGRAGACLGCGAPAPWVQRPLRGGCGAAISSVRLRPLLGLSGRGGGSGGGPSGPLAPPPDGRGGGGMVVPAPGASHRLGGRTLPPPPPYLEPDPRAGPRWGPSCPPSSSRVAGRPRAAVRVSGQRLAGCGAVGSPSRSLSPPSLPREVARAPSSRRTVGGAWVGGPSSPPHFLVSAVWAVTCAAACVGAGAVAAAGYAGGSASGRGRCARPGGASCWRPHP